MLKAGDKIVLKKEMGAFRNVGEVCDVVSIDDGIISFKFGNGMHLGCMTEDEFEKYFEYQKKAPTITLEQVNDIYNSSSIDIKTIYGKCTVVTAMLPNGFVITESSACVSPSNYDEEVGISICARKIKDKIWELEGYALQNRIYEENRGNFDW